MGHAPHVNVARNVRGQGVAVWGTQSRSATEKTLAARCQPMASVRRWQRSGSAGRAQDCNGYGPETHKRASMVQREPFQSYQVLSSAARQRPAIMLPSLLKFSLRSPVP